MRPRERGFKPKTSARGRGERLCVYGVLASLCLAAGLRFYDLGLEAFWQDELHSLYNSAGTRAAVENLPHGVIVREVPRFADLTPQSTFRQVWRTMDEDSHPPAYFLLLLAWRRLVGDGEAAVRTLPVIFSILSIMPVALIAMDIGRPRLAPLLALLHALAFNHILMAQENRPYALSLLLVSTSFWLVVRIERRWAQWSNRARVIHLAVYAITVFLAAMTHYFSVLALVGQGVYALLRLRGAARTAWAATVGAAALAFCLIWVPHLLRQRDFIASQDWLIEGVPDHAERTVLRLADLPTRQLFLAKRFLLDGVNSLTGGGMLLAACLIAWFYRERDALLFACWYFAPVCILGTVDFTTKQQLLTHLRYSSAAIPGLIGLIALAAARLPRFLGGLAIVAVCAASARTVYYLPAQHNPHTRIAAGILAADMRPDDLVIYDAVDWPSFWALRLFQTISHYLPYNPPTLLLRKAPDPDLRAQFAEFERIYVVTPRVADNAPEIPDYLWESHPYVLASDQIFEVGWVYLFTKTPS